MENLRIVPATEYSGEGISRGLARGLLVYYGDCNLTGEGMGLGSIALRDQEYTYFSRSWTDSDDLGLCRRTFTIDTRMRWTIRGKPSGLFTRLIESGIRAYMKLPFLQGVIMRPVLPLRNLLGIHPLFETIPPRGKVSFTYRVDGPLVEVKAGIEMTVGPHDTLCLLNELGAAWFTAGWDGERPVPPPPGWEQVRPGELPVSFIDPLHGIRFFMGRPTVQPPVPVTIYRGRERTGDLSWAGFCIELGPIDASLGVPEIRYSIGFAPGGS